MKKKHKHSNSRKKNQSSTSNSSNSSNSKSYSHGNSGTNGTNANNQSIATPSVPHPVQEQSETPQPAAATKGNIALQSAQQQSDKQKTNPPKRKCKFLSGIKRFFGKIRKGLRHFGNNILRKPKPPKNPDPLRNPTRKPVVLQNIDKWLDPTRKLWKRLMWRLYDDICESFWKFFAYELAIIATTFAILSYFYIIPWIQR